MPPKNTTKTTLPAATKRKLAPFAAQSDTDDDDAPQQPKAKAQHSQKKLRTNDSKALPLAQPAPPKAVTTTQTTKTPTTETSATLTKPTKSTTTTEKELDPTTLVSLDTTKLPSPTADKPLAAVVKTATKTAITTTSRQTSAPLTNKKPRKINTTAPTEKQTTIAKSQDKAEIDDLFGDITKSKHKTASKAGVLPKKAGVEFKKAEEEDHAASHVAVQDDMGWLGQDAAGRKKTEEGFLIYTYDELKFEEGGDTELCPFDCDCCFA